MEGSTQQSNGSNALSASGAPGTPVYFRQSGRKGWLGQIGQIGQTPPEVFRRRPPALAHPWQRDECVLPPAVARRAEPLLREGAMLGFDQPLYAVVENRLALEPDAYIILRHRSGNAALQIVLRWNEPPRLYFLTRFRPGAHGMGGIGSAPLFISGNEAIPRSGPAYRHTCRHSRHRTHLLEPLWEAHKRAVALDCEAVVEPISASDMATAVALFSEWNHTVHDRAVAGGRLTPLERGEFQRQARVLRRARDYAAQISASGSGSQQALIFSRLVNRARRHRWQTRWPLHGVAVLMLVALGLLAIGGASGKEGHGTLLAAGGAMLLHLLVTAFTLRLGRWRLWTPAGAVAVAALAAPLTLLGIGTALILSHATPPGPAIPFVLGGSLLLLPLPGLDGGRLLEAVLYSRSAWVKPLMLLAAGALIGVAGWAWGSHFLIWVGGVIGLAPLLDQRHPRLARRLRREIDWSHGLTPSSAHALIGRVQSAFPRQKGALFEETVLRVYDTLVQQPPVWRTTGWLLLLYVVALLAPAIPAALYLERSPTISMIVRAGDQSVNDD